MWASPSGGCVVTPYEDTTDTALAKALAHPLRSRVLGLLEGRTASPSDLAQDLKAPLGVVSYHVRRLDSLGFLRLVKRVPKRGAVEHYYTAVKHPHPAARRWGQLPSLARRPELSAELARIDSAVSDAVLSGGFDEEEARLSRTLVTVDRRGLKALGRELERLTGRIEKIEAASNARLRRSRSASECQATVVVMLFNSPDADAIDEGRDREPRARVK